jgi:hypothetical protein
MTNINEHMIKALLLVITDGTTMRYDLLDVIILRQNRWFDELNTFAYFERL